MLRNSSGRVAANRIVSAYQQLVSPLLHDSLVRTDSLFDLVHKIGVYQSCGDAYSGRKTLAAWTLGSSSNNDCEIAVHHWSSSTRTVFVSVLSTENLIVSHYFKDVNSHLRVEGYSLYHNMCRCYLLVDSNPLGSSSNNNRQIRCVGAYLKPN